MGTFLSTKRYALPEGQAGDEVLLFIASLYLFRMIRSRLQRGKNDTYTLPTVQVQATSQEDA